MKRKNVFELGNDNEPYVGLPVSIAVLFAFLMGFTIGSLLFT